MKTITLSMITIMFNVLLLSAQSGNTIEQAITVDGTEFDVDVLDYNNATESGLSPNCGSNEDVFYKHITSNGDNKMTIGMVSLGLTLLTQIEYQIWYAPNGVMEDMVPLTCDQYNVIALVGGSFVYVIDDVDGINSYYLRVFKTSQLGINLSSLLGGTSITMSSEYDATLSTNTVTTNEMKFVVDKENINLINNIDYNQFSIYSLSGKKIISNEDNQVLNTIDISQLNKGLYVINLEGASGNKAHKFIKQ